MYPWKRVFSWLMLRPALEPPVHPGSVEIEAGRMGRGETQEEEGQEWVEVEIIDYRLFIHSGLPEGPPPENIFGLTSSSLIWLPVGIT